MSTIIFEYTDKTQEVARRTDIKTSTDTSRSNRNR